MSNRVRHREDVEAAYELQCKAGAIVSEYFVHPFRPAGLSYSPCFVMSANNPGRAHFVQVPLVRV